VDSDSGAVVAATLGGWSCSGIGPAQFDGTYLIEGLPVGRNYKIYTESLNGAVPPSSVSNALTTLCRNVTTDPGWPPLQGCVVPAADMKFTMRARPSP
jgi:hypothetical protein